MIWICHAYTKNYGFIEIVGQATNDDAIGSFLLEPECPSLWLMRGSTNEVVYVVLELLVP